MAEGGGGSWEGPLVIPSACNPRTTLWGAVIIFSLSCSDTKQHGGGLPSLGAAGGGTWR